MFLYVMLFCDVFVVGLLIVIEDFSLVGYINVSGYY